VEKMIKYDKNSRRSSREPQQSHQFQFLIGTIKTIRNWHLAHTIRSFNSS